MLNLGNLLDDAASPSKPGEAIYWYKRAVRGGSHAAAANLATHYESLGQRRWFEHWIKVAARMATAMR